MGGDGGTNDHGGDIGRWYSGGGGSMHNNGDGSTGDAHGSPPRSALFLTKPPSWSRKQDCIWP